MQQLVNGVANHGSVDRMIARCLEVNTCSVQIPSGSHTDKIFSFSHACDSMNISFLFSLLLN